MADSINNFFNSAGQQMGDMFGNPRAGLRPITASGARRGFFTLPNDLLSSVITVNGPVRAPFLPISPSSLTINGLARTIGGSNAVQLQEVNKIGSRLQQGGFLPLNYTSRNGEYFLSFPSNPRTTSDVLNDDIDSFNLFGDYAQSDFKFSLQDFVKFNSAKNQLETADGGPPDAKPWEQTIDQSPYRLGEYLQSPYDNEDPVYFGFEIIVNVDSSPLFNGELETFLNQMAGYKDYTEFTSRLLILNQFKNEFGRYFKYSRELTTKEINESDLILATDTFGLGIPAKEKHYYVRKIAGLEKLQENNTPSTKKFLSDYLKDILTLTFYEDTTLNLGTLASLYKLLYWSRNKGKSLIPENLLRFDCEIVISELRNFATLRKSGNMLQELASNLSRYRYKVYECQLYFNKMTHPDVIDLWPGQLEKTETFDVELSYKFSSMAFERYDPSTAIRKTFYNTPGQNVSNDPLAVVPLSPNTSMITTGASSITTGYAPTPDVLLNTYQNLSGFNISANSNGYTGVSSTTQSNVSTLQQNQNVNIYNLASSANPTTTVKGSSNNIYQNNVLIPAPHGPMTKKDIYGAAAQKLLQNLKHAALNDVQRALNAQFTLLNNSLNKARSSFGLGQIPAPTNVYTFPPGGQFFFDVQNSLRTFAGDVLTNAISKGG